MEDEKVYIVGNNSFIFGVFKIKNNAIIEKRMRRVNGKEKDVYIKKRFNTLGYTLDD